MEIDDLTTVARECARQIHGDKALCAVEEMPGSFPADKRYRAVIRVRGTVVEAKHAAAHSGAMRELARDLAQRSRTIAAPHERAAFQAAVLGL